MPETIKDEEGKVLLVFRDKNKAIVEGVNMVKKHMKPSAQNPQGGIVEKEAVHPYLKPIID